MNARKLTIKESTQAARAILAYSVRAVDVQGWIVEKTLRNIGTGFHIPDHVDAYGEDLRTQKDLAEWLRRFAVDTTAQTIEDRAA